MEAVFTAPAPLGGGLAIGLGAVLHKLGLGRIPRARRIMPRLAFSEAHDEFAWLLTRRCDPYFWDRPLGHATFSNGCSSAHDPRRALAVPFRSEKEQ